MDELAEAELWRGWIPARCFWPEGATEPSLEWCFAGERRLTGVCYDFDVTAFYEDPFHALFRRVESMRELRERLAGTEPDPAGFIFHCSRTGSTLVAQMLAVAEHHTVASEPSFVTPLLRESPSIPVEGRADWFQAALRGFGLHRGPLFVKFGTTAITQLATIRAAFPDTPCIFLYREPIEVLQSLHQTPQPGSILVSHIDAPNAAAAASLHIMLSAALRAARRGEVHLVNYNELPSFVGTELVDLFGIRIDEATHRKMVDRGLKRGKSPSSSFTADGERKRREATPAVAAAADEISDVYAELEAVRAAQRAARDDAGS